MEVIVVTRRIVTDIILTNFATAGIIEQSEMEKTRHQLNKLHDDDIVGILLDSMQMKEGTGKADAMPIVPVGEISQN